jgi:hypothetical protein
MVELEKCRAKCYPDVSQQALEARYDIYGGVARTIFGQYILDPNVLVDMEAMDGALSNTEAVNGIKVVSETTAIHKESHTLIHCVSGKARGLGYQFVDVALASKYVGEELWKRYHNEMATKLREFLGGSDNQLSRGLFETYMHLTLQRGNVSLPCRNLKTGKIEENFELKSALKESRNLKNGELPSNFEEDVYYEGIDNFPSLDGLIAGVGMMQATVSDRHPIMGVQTLQQVCTIFNKKINQRATSSRSSMTKRAEPVVKFYFVVPPHRFQKFKQQPIQTMNGGVPQSVPNIEQYVLQLDFGISKPDRLA